MIRTPENETRDDNHPTGPREKASSTVPDEDDRGRHSTSDPRRAEPSEQGEYLVFLVCAFLVLAVGLVFGQTLRHRFVSWDDGLFVYSNPQVKAGLTLHGIAWAFKSGPIGEWYPLAPISHMLDCQLYGLNASGHHLTSVLLHVSASIILFLVLLQMTGDLWPSAFVAAVFAVHPLHVESVAWIAERRDVLSGLFFMLTLGEYESYVRHPSPGRYLAVAVLFALGLMAKSMLVTLPFVLLLLDYWPLGRFGVPSGGCHWPLAGQFPPETAPQADPQPVSAWRLVGEKIPLFVLAAAACAVTLLTHVFGDPSIDRIAGLPMGWRAANALVSCVAYLGQLVYPVGLAPFYPHPGTSLPMWKVAGALVLLTAITASVVVWRRKCPYLFVGWFWYLGMLAPVLGLLQTGLHAMADRYTYLSQIGLYIALAWGAAAVAASWPSRRWVLGVGAAVVLGVLMGCAWQQTSYWRDDETLWTHTLACTAPSAVAELKLGVALGELGRQDEAIAHYERALKIDPDYSLPHNNLGVAMHLRGKLDEAITHYRKALELDPEMSPNSASTHYNLGKALSEQGKLGEAIAQFEIVLKIDPADAMAHNNLANALVRQGKLDDAIAHYEQALKIDPRCSDAHFDFGRTLYNQGRSREAIAHWLKAIRLQPAKTSFLCRLAWARATSPEDSIRNGAEAVALAEHANRLSGGDAGILDTLAAAYAETGQFSKAVKTAEQALELASAQNDTDLVAALQARIKLYQTGSKFREEAPTSAQSERSQ